MLPDLVRKSIGDFPSDWFEAGFPENTQELDHLILNRLRDRIGAWEMPGDLLPATDKNNRWRIVSCMQKAIRHGDPDMAMNAAHAGVCVEPSYVFRRLGICAIEDVGVGNLFPVMATLAILGNAKVRHELGDKRVAAYLAGAMAEGVKDRLACELLVWLECDTSLAQEKEEWAKLPDDELVKLSLNEDLPMHMRVLAAWLLAGTKRFWGRTVPKENDRDRGRVMRLLREIEMPVALYYVAEMVARRVVDGLFVSLFMIWQMLYETETCSVREMEIPPGRKIGLLSSAGYDMHTREGKVAINKFFRECEEVGRFLQYARNDAMKERMKGCGIFVAEGGIIRNRLVYKDSEMVYDEAHKHEMLETGLPVELHEEFLGAIVKNIDVLNECRRKVIWAKNHPKK